MGGCLPRGDSRVVWGSHQTPRRHRYAGLVRAQHAGNRACWTHCESSGRPGTLELCPRLMATTRPGAWCSVAPKAAGEVAPSQA